MGLFSKKSKKDEFGKDASPNAGRMSEADTLPPAYDTLTKEQIKRATRTRKTWCWIASFCLFVSVIFLILVEIGNTFNKPVLRNIWFIQLNLSEVVPTTIPNSVLLNSIAQTLGLHDFYQVGLWGYCEGYDKGVTDCSSPQALYWFNPVQIILSELISGATIALPAEITSVLNILEIASKWMFGLFLTGACLSTVLIFIMPCSVYSRWTAFLVAIISFFNALFVTAASIVATVMFIIIRNVFANNGEVNIGATIGIKMFVFMWIASAGTLIAFIIQLALSCCCASRRDVRRGKKRGSKKAYTMGEK